MSCSSTKDWISPSHYDRLREFVSSDHKPVYGVYQVIIQHEFDPLLRRKPTPPEQPSLLEISDEEGALRLTPSDESCMPVEPPVTTPPIRSPASSVTSGTLTGPNRSSSRLLHVSDSVDNPLKEHPFGRSRQPDLLTSDDNKIFDKSTHDQLGLRVSLNSRIPSPTLDGRAIAVTRIPSTSEELPLEDSPTVIGDLRSSVDSTGNGGSFDLLLLSMAQATPMEPTARRSQHREDSHTR